MKFLMLHQYLCAQKDNGMSIWDSLAFLAAKLIIEKKISSVELQAFSTVFEDNYGYKIPFHPLKSLFTRMVDSGFLEKRELSLTPNFYKISEYVQKNNTVPVDLSIIVKQIWNYVCEKDTAQKYTFDEVECALLDYLKKNQYEIINCIVNEDDFSIVKDEKLQFYINSFIFDKITTSFEYKQLLLDLVIANINLSSIFFEVDDSIKANCTIYIDTPIIFRLMGVEGRYKQEEYKDFIKKLHDMGFKLFIFEDHYTEIEENIQESIIYASDRINYKPELASPLSCYFYNNHFPKSEMELFQHKIDSTLQEYEITNAGYNYEESEKDIYNIDELALYKCIDIEYSGSSRTKDACNDPKIWTDIKAISNVYRLRQNKGSSNIEELQYIFLTSNSALSRANKEYNLKENKKFNKFQECLTDTFLGSYLWIQNNHDMDFIKRKILSASYEYIQARPEVKKAFLEKVELKKEEFKPDEYLWLRSLVGKESNIIAAKCCNLVDSILDSTPEELLKEHDKEIARRVAEEKNAEIKNISDLYKSEMEEKEQFKSQSSKQAAEKENTLNSIRDISQKIARFITDILGLLYAGLLIMGFIISLKNNVNLYISIPIGVVLLIPSFISFYFGMTIKGFTKPIYEKIYKFLCKKLKMKE